MACPWRTHGLPESVRIVRIEGLKQCRPVDRIGSPTGKGLIDDVVQDRLVLIFTLAGSAIVSGTDTKHSAVSRRTPGQRQTRAEAELFRMIWIRISRRPQSRDRVHVDKQIVFFLERREVIIAKPGRHGEVPANTPLVLEVGSDKVLRSDAIGDDAVMERAGARIQIARVLDLRGTFRRKF